MSEPTPQPTGSLLVSTQTRSQGPVVVDPAKAAVVVDPAGHAVIQNLDEIAARIDGMVMRGNFVGLAIVQAASDAADPPTFAGSLENFLMRRCAVPGVIMTGVHGVDFATPNNIMPGAVLETVDLVRWNGANSDYLGATLRLAVTPRANLQKSNLEGVDARGWHGDGIFLEEARIVDIVLDDHTLWDNAHLADTVKGKTVLKAHHVPGADFGPGAQEKGNLRSSARKAAAEALRTQADLG